MVTAIVLRLPAPHVAANTAGANHPLPPRPSATATAAEPSGAVALTTAISVQLRCGGSAPLITQGAERATMPFVLAGARAT
jgi:hypothetical protein